MNTLLLLALSFNFALSPAQIKTRCDATLKKADTALATLAQVPKEKRTWDNTVWAFDQILAGVDDSIAEPVFLKYVSPDKSVRDAGGACEEKYESYKIDVFARESLFTAIKDYAGTRPALEGEDKRLLKKLLLAFKRNGLELPPAEREQVKKWKQELVTLESEFDKNIAEYQDPLWITDEELAGLPPDFVEGLQKNAKGLHRVTLDYPDYFPFMENAKSEEARKKLLFKFENRAADKNVALLEKALGLRAQISHTLAYPTHPNYLILIPFSVYAILTPIETVSSKPPLYRYVTVV